MSSGLPEPNNDGDDLDDEVQLVAKYFQEGMNLLDLHYTYFNFMPGKL